MAAFLAGSFEVFGKVSASPQNEHPLLLGDPAKAKKKLGWEPEITIEKMYNEMVQEDLKVAKRHAFLKRNGHDISMSQEH